MQEYALHAYLLPLLHNASKSSARMPRQKQIEWYRLLQQLANGFCCMLGVSIVTLRSSSCSKCAIAGSLAGSDESGAARRPAANVARLTRAPSALSHIVRHPPRSKLLQIF